jgi:chitin synthase
VSFLFARTKFIGGDSLSFRYMVVVKVGKPTERLKPGNRGKRDSQILLLHYLNRVHFDAPMSPLELEVYHQMRNVIGIDPAFYEYIFTVDADTVSKQIVISVQLF